MSEGAPARHPSSELIAALLLGIAGALTAFAAYSAAILDGDALADYTMATQELSDANQFYSESVLQVTSDQQLFVQFALAGTSGNEELAVYVRDTLMGENLRSAVEWWEQSADAVTPFDDVAGNPYGNVAQEEASRLEAASVASRASGADADEEGDRYELAAVLFALTLFFAGIATLLHRRALTWGLLGGGALTLLVGIGVVVAAM
jgi:hypothetical protein